MSLDEARHYIPNKKVLHTALTRNGYILPDYRDPMCT